MVNSTNCAECGRTLEWDGVSYVCLNYVLESRSPKAIHKANRKEMK